MSAQAARLWEQALALNRAAADVSPAAGRLPPLMFFTDPVRTPSPWLTAARLPEGAAVVYRGFGRPQAKEEAMRLRRATRAASVRLLIGRDVDLALAVGADGLHLPEGWMAEAPRLRPMLKEGAIVTGAAHGEAAASRAAVVGLDAVIFSPVFPSASPSAGAPLGVRGLERLMAAAGGVPAYALGGVTADGAGRLAGTGVCGLCGVEGIERAFA